MQYEGIGYDWLIKCCKHIKKLSTSKVKYTRKYVFNEGFVSGKGGTKTLQREMKKISIETIPAPCFYEQVLELRSIMFHLKKALCLTIIFRLDKFWVS